MCFLERCCWSATLRKGTLIIGYLNLVLDTVGFIVTMALLVVDSEYKRYHHDDSDSTTVLFLILFAVIVQFVISILLITGASKGRKGYLLPWINLTILGLIGVVISFFFTDEQSSKKSSDYVTGGIVGKMLAFALNVYFIMVVASHYNELKQIKSKNAPIPA